MSGDDQIVDCPLCMEQLDFDDKAFFPCTCGYQICRFCWHRIRTNENCLCPACRKPYPEDPADFKPVSAEQISRIKNEKRQQNIQRKQKISENLKHLANVRVVQRNLVFVVGLSQRLADPEILKKMEYFGKFGKVHKVVINHTTSYAGSQGPSASAYITYHRSEDALRAIEVVNNIVVDSRTLKASLGTTKYCSHFLKNQHCPKSDCMYLHELGDPKASFTKDEMQQGKHQEYEKELHEILVASVEKSKERKHSPSPTNGQQQQSSSPSTQIESWPNVQNCESTDDKLEVQTASQTTVPQKSDDDECKNIIEDLKTTGMSADQEVSMNKVQDQISESSQSSSASPVQYSQTLEAWPTGSSQSSESSDTDSTGVRQTKTDVNHLINGIVRMGLTNGYSKGFVDRNSVQNEKPPRFLQQQEHVPTSSQIAQSPFTRLTNCNEVSSPPQNHSFMTSPNQVIVNKSSNPNHSFFSPAVETRNISSPEKTLPSGEWIQDKSDSLFVHSARPPDNSSMLNGSTDAFNYNQTDDELGFDPWNESTKGLADLIEKEINTNRVNNDPRDVPAGMLDHMYSSQNNYISMPPSRRPCGAPPGFTPNRINNFNVPNQSTVNGVSDRMDRMAMGRTSLPADQSSLYGAENFHNSNTPIHKAAHQVAHQVAHMNGKIDKTKNLQEELRAMLPNINISFGTNPSYPSPPLLGTQNPTIPQQNDVYKDQTDIAHWNYKTMLADDNSPASNNLLNSSLFKQHNLPMDYHARLSSAQQFASRLTNQHLQQQSSPQQQPPMSWHNASFNQMPPGFAPHIMSKHLSEQQILDNLPGVL